MLVYDLLQFPFFSSTQIDTETAMLKLAASTSALPTGSLRSSLSSAIAMFTCLHVTLFLPWPNASISALLHSVLTIRGTRREQLTTAVTGHPQAVIDVTRQAFPVNRQQPVGKADALFELAVALAAEAFVEFGLAEQDDLQQLALFGFDIRYQA